MLALLLLTVLALGPLLVETPPVTWVAPHASDILYWGSKAGVAAAMLLAVALRAWLDRREEPWPALLPMTLVVLAGLMTAWHWYRVDRVGWKADWQRQLYHDILNHAPEADGRPRIPHQFRPLPYGFVRTLERLTGDWWFSCLAYRWFFTYWFLWGSYRFARLFHTPARALLTVGPLVALYPCSVMFYWGQLTDPLSHALFALALIYVVQDRWVALAAALALGILAKETVVVVVPAYGACYWRKGLPALWKTALLGAVCMAAFLAARLPVGWRPGNESLNGLHGLMIGTNLGIGEPVASTSTEMIYQNYLQPLLFVGTFLPFIAWRWRRLDRRLRVLSVTVTPLLLLSNLCFGWMYESRNYMPLVPLLATMAVPPVTVPGGRNGGGRLP